MRIRTFLFSAALVGLMACNAARDKPTLYIDNSVNPGDDFYTYVNGNWGNEQAGENQTLNLTMRADVKYKLIQTIKNRNNPDRYGKIYDFYESLAGNIPQDSLLKSLQTELNILHSVDSSEGLGALVAMAFKRGYRGPVSGEIRMYSRDVPIFDLLPGRAGFSKYFTLKETYYESFPLIFRNLAPRLNLHWTEKQIAEVDSIQREMRELQRWYKFQKEKDTLLTSIPDNLPFIHSFIDALEIEGENMILAPPASVLNRMEALMSKYSWQTWKNYYTWVFYEENLFFSTDSLSTEFGRLISEHTNIGLNGARSNMRAISVMYDCFADPLIGMYKENFVNDRVPAKIGEMVEEIRDAMINNVNQTDWLEATTKKHISNRLDSTQFIILFPDDLFLFENTRINPNDPVGNIHRAEEDYTEKLLSMVGLPEVTNDLLFGINTLDDSPTCRRRTNQIIITACFSRDPLFDLNYEDAFNYGGIGFYIGHEMSHLFDYGSRFSIPEEYYWKENEKLKTQYNSYISKEGIRMDGQQTRDENFSDIVGLKSAYDAFLAAAGSSARTEQEKKDFFYAFANSQREYRSDSSEMQLIRDNEHSLYYIRVNGAVRNIDSFYEVFDVTEADSLYLQPEDRIRLW